MEIKVKEQELRQLTKPELVAKFLMDLLATESEIDREKEHFWIIGMNGRLVVKYVELATLGIQNASIWSPTVVFRLGIMKGIAKIIIAHNHPAGEVTPSEADRRTYEELRQAGKILQIPVIDHIIIGFNKFYSLAKNQEIYI
jgi:DNA repair protein RadC